MITDNFRLEGVVPLTRSDIASQLNDMQTSILKRLDEQILRNTPPAAAVTPVDVATQLADDARFTKWLWKNQRGSVKNKGQLAYHSVPENWVFPKETSCANLWSLWWHGNVAEKIQPYSRLQDSDFVKKTCVVSVSKTKKVMEAICKIGREHGIISASETNLRLLRIERNNEIFQQTYPLFRDSLTSHAYTAESRIGSTLCSTIYNLIAKKTKKAKGAFAPSAPSDEVSDGSEEEEDAEEE